MLPTIATNKTLFQTKQNSSPQAGIIEEMLEDTMEGLEDTEELEEAAQEEVDKVSSSIKTFPINIQIGNLDR